MRHTPRRHLSNLKKIVIVLLSFFLSSCMNLKDFQNMSAESRADLICSRNPTVIESIKNENIYDSAINQTSMDLSRGYKVFTQCREVKIQTPKSIYCNSNTNVRGSYNTPYQANLDTTTQCEQNNSTSYEQHCTDTPVQIDADLEKEKLVQYQFLKEKATKTKNDAYNTCYRKSIILTPEEAFKAYSQ